MRRCCQEDHEGKRRNRCRQKVLTTDIRGRTTQAQSTSFAIQEDFTKYKKKENKTKKAES